MKRATGFSGRRVGTAGDTPDVIVIGGGLIGLASAAALAERGLRVDILSERRPGEASLAAAGLLAPSVEDVSAGKSFAVAGRDRYPSYLEWLGERTGMRVPLNRKGVLEVALHEAQVNELRAIAGARGEWLDQRALASLEPAIAHAKGALYHDMDGAVDNVALLNALTRLLRNDPRITFARTSVATIDVETRVVQTASGDFRSAAAVVLAMGAWSGRLRGLPRQLPVQPVRGQMLSLPGLPLERPLFGENIYLVPRVSGETLVGSTMENVGFDATTTPEALAALLASARTLCPQFRETTPRETWAGLRPVTPDLLPIIGADPDYPSLFYACGHSRNGILMGPLTADCVAKLVTGEAPEHDLSAFGVTRFREPLPD